MMKWALVLLALFATQAMALEDVHVPFSTSQNITNTTEIHWVAVDDVQAQCNVESRKRGMSRFTVAVEACSFWDKNGSKHSCTIVTSKTPNMHTLGHETRHCFQGEWHR